MRWMKQALEVSQQLSLTNIVKIMKQCRQMIQRMVMIFGLDMDHIQSKEEKISKKRNKIQEILKAIQMGANRRNNKTLLGKMGKTCQGYFQK